MNQADIDKYEKLSGQLASAYKEISFLSKKNPNDAVNKFKLNFLNKLLKECNEFLSKKYKPFDDFECFDEDDMPQTSDVVFILSQYIECFEKLRSDNAVLEYGTWYWNSSENIKVRTAKPKKLKD